MSGVTRCLAGLATAALAAQLAGAAAYVRQTPGEHSWVIGNDAVERTLRYTEPGGLRTGALVYKVSGRDFTESSKKGKRWGDEFSFAADGETVTGATARLLDSQVLPVDHGQKLALRFQNSGKTLEVTVFYTVYDEYPAIRKRIAIKNLGTRTRLLSRLTFESLAAAPGMPAELSVRAGYGAIPRELFFTGRVSDPAIFVRNTRTGEGMAILNEAPGYLKRTETGDGWTEELRVMYDTDLFPFKRALAGGETFESASSSLVFFEDGHDLDDSHWVVARYVGNVLARRHGEGGAPWIYNTWEPFFRDVDLAAIKEVAPIARRIGIDIFTIDDGWQAEYGSNDVNGKNFPGGMAAIRSVLDANHLKLGLWVPLAAIGTNTAEYRTHPEWVCRNQDGSPKFTGTAAGQRAVMCLGSAYREAAAKRLLDLIEQAHPAYLKIDLTTVFNAYGEQPGCYARGHIHGDWAESLFRIYEGLEYIGRRLYREHPEVLIDYTFELWGEKHLIDPALLQSADLDWLSNVTDASTEDGGALHARSLLYPRAFSIPAEAMLIGNLRAPVPPREEHFGTVIGSAPLLMGDLRQLSEPDRQWYAERIGNYKELRRRAALSDSFFPLGHWEQPEITAFDGFARLSRKADGVVVLFRNESNSDAVEVKILPPPDAQYDVRSLVSGTTVGRVDAGELRNGWKVRFAPGQRTEVLELRRRNQGP